MFSEAKVINDQHEELFYLLRNLTCTEDKKVFLQKFVEHIRYEEDFMRSINYPEYEEHSEEHFNMLEKIKSNYEKGHLKSVERYFYNHTQTSDAKILEWLESKEL